MAIGDLLFVIWRSENWKKTCVILEVSWVAFWYYHELFGVKVWHGLVRLASVRIRSFVWSGLDRVTNLNLTGEIEVKHNNNL
jgi:hypothetical protein